MPSRPCALRRQRLYARVASRQVERSVAFRRWKSATDSNRRRAFQGGVHLILANPPGVSYKSEPRRFRETRSTWWDSFTVLLCCAVQYSTEIGNDPQNQRESKPRSELTERGGGLG